MEITTIYQRERNDFGRPVNHFSATDVQIYNGSHHECPPGWEIATLSLMWPGATYPKAFPPIELGTVWRNALFCIQKDTNTYQRLDKEHIPKPTHWWVVKGFSVAEFSNLPTVAGQG